MTAALSPTKDGGPAAPTAADGSTAAGWHEAIRQFKRALLEQALACANGNRTYAARALGLQRTYLLRLIRDLDVAAPPAGHGTAAHSPAPR